MEKILVSNAGLEEKVSVTESSSFLPWLYWGVAAFFFFVEYFVRVSPSVMADDLMRELNVTALALGSFSAFFYYAYLGMQVPVGVLVDRFGPRMLLTLATFLCAISSYWFAHTDSVASASAARFILGFGSSFAFVGALKLGTSWLPAKYWGIIVGITQGLGMLGACVGEAPMASAVEFWGWRHTLEIISVLFLCMSAFIFFVVRDKSAKLDQVRNNAPAAEGIFKSLGVVLRNPQTWYNAMYAGLLFAPTALFGELWGVTFLTSSSTLSLHEAATGVGLIFIGWTLGGPAVGWFSDKTKRRKPTMYISALSGLLILPFIVFFPDAMPVIIYTMLFMFGFFNAGLVASYAVCTEINPKNVAGVALGFTNMASVIIGALLQPVVGGLLDWQWDGLIQNGTPIYSSLAFKNAMMVMPVASLLALLCAFKVKETFCLPLENRED